MGNKTSGEKERKLHLAFFSFGILEQGGGCENYFIETASGLMKYSNKINTSVVTASAELTEKLQHLLTIYFFKKHKVKSIYRESSDSVYNRLGNARYLHFSKLTSLPELLNQHDLIYSKNEILELFILKIYRRKIKPPIIVGVHTPVYYPYTPSVSSKIHNILYGGWFYKWLLKDVVAIKVNQAEDKKMLRDRRIHNNVSVIHHPYKVKNNTRKNNKAKQLRVLFAGRFSEQKGVDILIRAIENLARNGNIAEYEFKIAGSGEENLTKQIKILDKQINTIHYLGHVSSDEMKKLYDWTDVTLIPSRYETLNRVAAETAVAGKIAIASDIAGPKEIIVNKKTGYLIQPEPSAVVAVLKALHKMKHENPLGFKKMGKLAQERIIKKFDYDTVYEQLCKELFYEFSVSQLRNKMRLDEGL